MAEVKIPQVNSPAKSSLTRESSSLSSKPVESIDFKGSVKVKEPSRKEKIKSIFISEDAKDVGQYILWDILIPTIKRTIRDVIVGSTDRIFLGTNTPPSSNLYRERGITYPRHVNYAQASRQTQRPEVTRVSPRPLRSSFRLNEIIFDYREDAESVLEHMMDYLEDQSYVTVADYLKFCGQRNSNYTTENWGWYDLNQAYISGNETSGFMLTLPEPVVVKR